MNEIQKNDEIADVLFEIIDVLIDRGILRDLRLIEDDNEKE